ncbi:hypothetical protein N9H93_01585 [Rhizobiaceae bacterium]|nr:hypothetical protein [Rhizobiaceae bacterium]
MLKKIQITTIVFFAAMSLAPSPALADDHEPPMTFSETLQASFDALADARDSLRSEIGAALDGLSRNEARDVRDAYRDDVDALRAEDMSLRAQAHDEMTAAGVTAPESGEAEAEKGAVGRGSFGGADGRGDVGGAGGRGDEGGAGGHGGPGGGSRG